MDALTEALVRLLKRQEETDRRLRHIETLLAVPAREVAPEPAVRREVPPRPVEEPPVVASEVPPPVAPVAPSPEPVSVHRPGVPPPDTETQVGLTWVNRIGALTFVLAVAFFFKLAVENQWIGEAGRVILGTLAGLATIGAAEYFFRRGHQSYAHGVCATGIGILYLSFYASFGFYRLVPAGFAFVLMVAAVALAGVSALRYSSQAILVLGLIAGYSTPILLATGEDRPWVFFSYLLLLNGAAIAAARYRNWKTTEVFAAIATWSLYIAWFGDRFTAEKRLPAAVFAAAFYALFATSPIWILPALSQLAAAGAIAGIWEDAASPFITASVVLGAAGFGVAARRNCPWTANVALLSFLFSYVVWTSESAYDSRTFGPLFLGLTLLFALFFLWLPWRVLVRKQMVRSSDPWVAVVNAAIYFGAAYELLDSFEYDGYTGLFTIALSALHLGLAYYFWQHRDSSTSESTPALLAAGLAMCFGTLAIPIQFSGATITIAWAVEVGAAGWLAARTNSRRLLYLTLLLFCLTSARLALYDMSMYAWDSAHGIIVNSRFLAFVISAVSFGFAAWCLRANRLAGALALGAHAALLGGMTLELLDWTQRNFGFDSLDSVRTALLALLLAAYGVVLIATGVNYRIGLHRALGLALIAFVILKLYFYDVWSLLLVWRVVAFAALGAMLLLTSFFYSRYRTKIEALWKQEDGELNS